MIQGTPLVGYSGGRRQKEPKGQPGIASFRAMPAQGETMVAAYRVEVIRSKVSDVGAQISSPADVARHYGNLQRFDREHLVRLDLDTRNRVIGEETVSIGSANATLLSPREVFKGAILNSAINIILLHNHPSGDASPSDEDEEAAEKLRKAGELLGIPVLDFVVIGENGSYWSLSNRRVIRPPACPTVQDSQAALQRSPAPVGLAEKAILAVHLVDLIRTDRAVQQALTRWACGCPNIRTDL